MKIAAVTRTTEKTGATKEYFNGGAQNIETRESERNNFLFIKDGDKFEKDLLVHRTYDGSQDGQVVINPGEEAIPTIELNPADNTFDKGAHYKDENSPSPISKMIKSGVDEQDENITKIGSGDQFWGDLGNESLKALGKTGNSLLKSATGRSANEWSNTFSIFSNDDASATQFDTDNNILFKEKAEKFKDLHVDDWKETDLLNTSKNYANTMAEDYRGEVGKSNLHLTYGNEKGWAGVGNAAATAAANALGVGGLVQGVESLFDKDRVSTAEDGEQVLALNLATKNTIYTNKPGNPIQIRSRRMLMGDGKESGKYRNVLSWKIGDPISEDGDRTTPLGLLDIIRTQNFNMKQSAEGADYNTAVEFRRKQSLITSKVPSAAKYTEVGYETGKQIIYQKSADFFSSSGLATMSEEEARYINLIKQKNTYNKKLGYIYIKPFWNYSNAQERDFQIPFEFNPEISEGAVQANYATETLLNRLGQYHVYTGTNLSTLNITLSYMALAPDVLNAEMSSEIGKQYGTDAWMFYWTNNRIEAIEMQLRSLVFADVTSDNEGTLIKPPIIEVHLENNEGADVESVGDLYKYPGAVNNNNVTNSVGEKYLKVSAVLGNGSASRYKKYIVNSVQIEKLDDASTQYPSLYGRMYNSKYGNNRNPMYHITTSSKTGSDGEEVVGGYAGYSRRMGFKAILQCTEVVENFIDLVPDFKAYYDAWSVKNRLADYSSQYANNYFGIETDEQGNVKYKTVTDIIEGSLYSLVNDIASLEDRLISYYNEAVVISSMYNRAKGGDGTDKHIYKLNNPEKGKGGEATGEGAIYSRLSSKSQKAIDDSGCTANASGGDVVFEDIGPLEFSINLDVSDETLNGQLENINGTSIEDTESMMFAKDNEKETLCLKNIWKVGGKKSIQAYCVDSKDETPTGYTEYFNKILETAQHINMINKEKVISNIKDEITVNKFITDSTTNGKFTIGEKTLIGHAIENKKSIIEEINRYLTTIKEKALDGEQASQIKDEDFYDDITKDFKNIESLTFNDKDFKVSYGYKTYANIEDNGVSTTRLDKVLGDAISNALSTIKSKVKGAKSEEKAADKAAKKAAKETSPKKSETFGAYQTMLEGIQKEELKKLTNLENILSNNYKNIYDCIKECINSYNAYWVAVANANICNVHALVLGEEIVGINEVKNNLTLKIKNKEEQDAGGIVQKTENGSKSEIKKYELKKIKGAIPFSIKRFCECYYNTYQQIIEEFEALEKENPEVDLAASSITEASKETEMLASGKAFANLGTVSKNSTEVKTIINNISEDNYNNCLKQSTTTSEGLKSLTTSMFVAPLQFLAEVQMSEADMAIAEAAGKMYTFYSLQGLQKIFDTVAGKKDNTLTALDLDGQYTTYKIDDKDKDGENPESNYGLFEAVYKKEKAKGNNGFKDFVSSSQGLIPYTYRKILQNEDLAASMKIAGSSKTAMEQFGKLS